MGNITFLRAFKCKAYIHPFEYTIYRMCQSDHRAACQGGGYEVYFSCAGDFDSIHICTLATGFSLRCSLRR